MRILIIEDEKSSAERLTRLLKACNDSHEVVGVMSSNAEVIDFFASAHDDIDLIISDIQLGDGLSFDSLKQIPNNIPVIFSTAYNQYAIRAFKFNSIDYLLKPIDKDELYAALTKFETMGKNSLLSSDFAKLMEALKNQNLNYRERFLIPHRAYEFIVVPVEEISFITIIDGIVRICTMDGKTHILNMTLDEAESQLDPKHFMRVNRQFIVRAEAVVKLSRYFHAKILVHMAAFPDVQIIVSKGNVSAVKKWLNS